MHVLGAYPCQKFRLILRRDAGYYVMTVILPCMAVVVLSWLTFFVPVSLPTTTLTLALLMALSSLAIGVLCRTALAPELKGVSYLTVVDFWTTSCFLFVLSALILQLITASRASSHQQVGYEPSRYCNFLLTKICFTFMYSMLCGRVSRTALPFHSSSLKGFRWQSDGHAVTFGTSTLYEKHLPTEAT